MNETIAKLAKEKTVERLIKLYRLSSPYAEDLAQDIYIELLSKNEDKIRGLVERGEIEWFIRKMIKNNIASTTSPYYKNYEKFRKITENIDEKKTKI